MTIYPIIAERFKMDGGAVFGVVPKTIWQKQLPADEFNLVNLASRCLLADTGKRLILVDTGMGNKQSEKFFSYFYKFGPENLESSFAQAGYTFGQVTDVILTHLHFDHVGGALRNGERQDNYFPVFPNATYYVSKEQWDWAMSPNPREKASFLPENYLPLYEGGRLEFIYEEGEFCEGVTLEIKNGHTRGLIIPIFDYKGRKLVFTSDFISMVYHLPLPYVPAFDIEPIVSMREKAEFLERAVHNDFVLFFQHDHLNECCTLIRTGKGIQIKDVFPLSDL
ncbi:MAG TPA: MBL fold metallo-hydrolase [Bacteroidales bacterium]|nr:MBL fold metallo-hydrolase [Bacteroidales bacterium]